MDRIVLFIIITILFFLFSGQKPDSRKTKILFLVSSSLFLVLASALRGLSVGPDTHQYYLIFEGVKDLSFSDLWTSLIGSGVVTKDPMYWLFQKVFQLFSTNYNAYLGLVAILFYVSLGVFLFKNKLTLVEMYISYIFYLGLFYGFYAITGIRQTIAISFIMYAYLYLIKDKYIPFLLLMGIAFLFHASALVFLIAVFLLKIKNPKFIIWMVIILLPPIFMYRYEFFSLLVEQAGMEDRFGMYMDDSYKGSFSVLGLYLLVLIGVIFSYRSIVDKPGVANLIKLFSVCVIGLPLMFISGSGMRATQYFSISMFILVPVIVSNIHLNVKYFLATVFIFALIVFAYHDQQYVFYWQETGLGYVQ